MSYAATYDGHERVPGERHLRRENPLGLRKTYDDPADTEDRGNARRWSLGVATGALLVAGTFVAGAMGLNDGSAPLATGAAPEHARASPGNSTHGNNGDIGGPAVAPPPNGDRSSSKVRPAEPARPVAAAPAPVANERSLPPTAGSGGSSGTPSRPAPAPAPAPAPVPAPAPAPAPAPPPAPAPAADPGLVGGLVGGVTDTVGGVLAPVTGILGGGDQPAMTMINPGSELLGS